MITTDQSTLCELKIYTDSPWEGTQDVDIISVMAILYDRNCPYQLMSKVMNEYETNDSALVFCGSREKCMIGSVMFSEAGIKSIVTEV
jgi:hypothetical protein